MKAVSLAPADPKTIEAYRLFAGTCGPLILADLEDQIPGLFDPQNPYVTAHNLGQLSVLQIVTTRIAESQEQTTQFPEKTTDGQ